MLGKSKVGGDLGSGGSSITDAVRLWRLVRRVGLLGGSVAGGGDFGGVEWMWRDRWGKGSVEA